MKTEEVDVLVIESNNIQPNGMNDPRGIEESIASSVVKLTPLHEGKGVTHEVVHLYLFKRIMEAAWLKAEP